MSRLGPVFCHGVARGSQERGDVELPSHTLLEYKGRWSTGTHLKGMTLRLDTDAGKHRVLKGTNE